MCSYMGRITKDKEFEVSLLRHKKSAIYNGDSIRVLHRGRPQIGGCSPR